MYECLCRHFYSPTYNREILTRTDHINLLATPKGYRWYGPGGEMPIKARAFRGRSAKKKEKEEVPEKDVFPGMAQFMNGIWAIMTPEILLCLREILVEEFGLTPEAAVLFLMKQYLKTQREAELEANPPCTPTEEQLEWACNIARVIASKTTQYMELMTNAKRTKRTKMISDAVLQRLQKALGVKPDAGDTPLNRLLLRLVDGLAVWLSSVPGEQNMEFICSNLMTTYFNVPLQ